MNILFSADQCGAGKTTTALDRMAKAAGRFVFVVDRKEIAKQRQKELLKRAADAGRVAEIVTIVSDDDTKLLGGVGKQIEEAGHDLSDNRHVIVIITHAGMKRCRDWSGYAGWDAIIVDEIPDILDREDHSAGPWNRTVLERFYGLLETERQGISRLTFRGGVSPKEIPESWRAFHQRVIVGEAFCDITAWDDLEAPDAPSWSSWHMWDIHKLEPFEEVRFLGDSFTDHTTFHLLALDPTITFEAKTLGPARDWQKRDVVIRYVSEDRVASTRRFRLDSFAPDLGKIGHWLALAGTPQHLWTSNVGVKFTTAIPGKKTTPKQAGTNEFMDWHKASAIYAAKPSPIERRFFEMLGIDADVITASRESYDLNQFFMRTSLRQPDSTAPVELRCFDRHQAETFAAKLEAGYGLKATLAFDPIGLDDSPVSVGGRPPKNGKRPQTQDEKREANRLSQQRRRAARKETK